MLGEKQCKNPECGKRRKYPNGYRFCPFCGKPLRLVKPLYNVTEDKKFWVHKRIDPKDVSEKQTFNPDTDRMY